MVVYGVSRAALARARGVRSGTLGTGFHVEEGQAAATEGAAGTSSVSMPSLLAMQEAESGARQDGDARRHGGAVLDELTDLQRALLGEGGPDLDRLADLAERRVEASDPRLAGVLRAIQLRAKIELARHGRAASR